jgi:cytochrome c oxidase subunit II
MANYTFKPAAMVAIGCLTGCEGVQSVFTARTREAEAIVGLSWLLFIGGAAIFVIVMGLLAWSIASRHRPPPIRGTTLIMVGGFIFPAVTLAGLLTYSVSLSSQMTAPVAKNPLHIHITGHMWWWEVFYEDSGGERIETANEIRLPLGRPVSISVTSGDVIHSLWIPNLTGKIDMIPGRVNRIAFTPSKTGPMRGQCAEYCGQQHAKMAFHAVVESPEAFAAWFQRQAQPIAEPITEQQKAGRDAFIENGCGACHTVRGLPGADGELGPDLTHVGSRILIAGWFDGNVGTFGGWIASAQHLKPGNRMPSFDRLEGPTLRAIAAWLESLE